MSLILCGLGLATPQATTRTYDGGLSGLQFDYPTAWTAKKTKYSTVLSIPLKTTSELAKLSLFVLPISEPGTDWLSDEKIIDKQASRSTGRQWNEIVLGFPLYLSRSTYSSGGEPMVQFSGLIYSAQLNKIIFRLKSPAANADEVEGMLRSVLQSLRTVDVQDPTKKPDRTVVLGGDQPKTVQEPKVALTEMVTKTANRDVKLTYPKTWTATIDANGNGTFTLNSNNSIKIAFTVNSTLDSDPPQRALFKLSSDSLAQFSQVDGRDELAPEPNSLGCTVDRIWRRGTGSGKPLTSLEAYASLGSFYVLLHQVFPVGITSVPQDDVNSLIDHLNLQQVTDPKN